MRLIDAARIWDEAPHNAFTDLIRFAGEWLCVFREGENHMSVDGALRVIASPDGRRWTARARIAAPDADLRDPKLSATPDGRLMLVAAARPREPSACTHTLAWHSDDGASWGEPRHIGDPDFWLWRIAWRAEEAYAVGYDCRDLERIRIYRGGERDGFTPIADCTFAGGFPNESALAFHGDIAYCLLRRDGPTNSGLWGTARPPYTTWRWQDLGVRIGGPQMLILPDGSVVAAVRLHDRRVRTSLCRIDPAAATFTETLVLPSGGDTSYAGLALHDGRLWISYYSSHEGKTAIYLAQAEIDEVASPPPQRPEAPA